MPQHPLANKQTERRLGLAGHRAQGRRDHDPAEPEDEPGSRGSVDDPESVPLTPPVEDPLDSPGAGEPDWHDPDPQAPPRGDPPVREPPPASGRGSVQGI